MNNKSVAWDAGEGHDISRVNAATLWCMEEPIMYKRKILEVCVDSVESAIAAQKGGADRLELCSNIVIGGTTPSPGLFDEVCQHTNIKIHVLLRPRFGDFCYTNHEFEILLREAEAFQKAGADGLVIGILTSKGDLDTRRMRQLVNVCKPCSITLHRAFDICRDPFASLAKAADMGITTILTSGQEADCQKGKCLLKDLEVVAKDRITIMAGGGVDANVIRDFSDTSIRAFHMSGKVICKSRMEYCNPQVHMGIPGLSEFEIYRTDERKIKTAKMILQDL